ncbi:unnamed protein product [Diamesa hyperborea]
MAKFERPKNLEFPKVYHTFQAKDVDSDNLVTYRVQDLPEEYYEKALELMEKYQLPEETLSASKKLVENQEAFEICKAFVGGVFSEKLSLACFKDGCSDELIAVNVLMIATSDDDDFVLDDQDLTDIIEVITYTGKQFNPFEHYKVSKYLTDYGLLVHPDYRKLGIATEMLKARIPIMKELGIELTASDFTGTGSQIAAVRAGYTETYSIKYSELFKMFPNFDFTDAEFYKKFSLKLV